MSENREVSAGSVVLAFLLGGVVGAGVALLYAPQSGKETREKIRELSDDAKDRVRELADDAKEKIRSVTEEAREKLHESYEHGKEVISQKKGVITSAVEAGREAMHKERKRLSEES